MSNQRLDALLAKRPWLPFAVLCLASFLYRADILLTSRSYYNNDIYQEYAPYKLYLKEAISNGRLPLWCPEQFSGMPFVPNPQAGVFYPTTPLFLVLPFGRALALHFFLHNVLAGCFMWALLRRWNLGREAALLGAVLALASGFQAWEVIHPQTLAASLWIIPALFFLEGAVSRASLSQAWAGGVCVAMSFLAGNPQMFLGILYLSVLYALYRTPWRAMSLKRHLFWWCAFGAGLGVASAMAVPFLEIARIGGRSGGMGYAEAASYSLNLKSLFNLLSPFSGVSLGLPPHLVHQHADEWTQGRALGFIGYMGGVALLLSACGFLGERRKPWTFFFWTAVVVLWIGLGKNAGPLNLHKLLYIALPGFRFLRTPFRYLFLYDISLAVLAAFGVQTLKERTTGRLLPCLFLVATLALVLGDCWGRENPSRSFLSFHLVPTVVAAAASLSLLFFRQRSWSVGLLLLLAPFELFWYKNRAWPVEPDEILAYPHAKPLAAFLASQEDDGRVFLDKHILLPGSPLDCYAPRIVLDPYLALPANVGMVFGLKNASGYNQLMLADYKDLLSLGERARRWLRVRFLVTPTEPETPFPAVWSSGNSRVYDLGRPLPRVWVLRRKRLFPNEEALIQYMRKPTFDPLEEVLFLREHAPPEVLPEALTEEYGGGLDRTAVLKETPESIEIDVHLSSPAFIVFPDPHCPGWRAAVDGKEVPLLQADLAFRAVFCPEGRHRMELVYRPASLWMGLLGSCAALGLGLLCFVLQRKGVVPCVS